MVTAKTRANADAVFSKSNNNNYNKNNNNNNNNNNFIYPAKNESACLKKNMLVLIHVQH